MNDKTLDEVFTYLSVTVGNANLLLKNLELLAVGQTYANNR